jgi:hypothetical protein
MPMKPDKQEDYERYAEHCLKMARLAPDRESRILQREMAAEWLSLASREGMSRAGASANGADRATGQHPL